MTWQKSKAWSDKYLPEIKMILGLCFIKEPVEEEDALRNTDLVVMRLEAIRIGCRVRDQKYYERYPDQFTIRSERPSGNETELGKILAGWGDYLFYGFATNQHLIDWRIGDLKVFRLWHQRQCVKLPVGVQPGMPEANRDGSSRFRAFRWDDLPSEFVVARMNATWLDRGIATWRQAQFWEI